MRFIHTSDWQIGKTFRFVDDETLAILRAERLEVISRIGLLAQEHGACAVLVAGDVFDVTGVSLTTLLQPWSACGNFQGWSGTSSRETMTPMEPMAPGNGCLRTSVPTNIKLHTTTEARQITGSSAWILPAILTQRHSLADTTCRWTVCHSEGGAPHWTGAGSVRSFGSTDASTKNLLAIDRAAKAKSYLSGAG